MTAIPPGAESVREDWFEHAFGDLYPVIYAHRTVEAAEPEARFAADILRLRRGDRLLDLCCGCGRHLVHLCPRVGSSAGLDYSEELLWLARGLVPADTTLVRADMRHVPFRNAFDAVTNFFTSFGYFFTDAENLESIKNMTQALRPGGRFFIDYLNPVHTADTLVPTSTRETAGFIIEERRWIDSDTQRINKTTQVSRDGGVVSELHESVQMYGRDAFLGLLDQGGLRVHTLYGAYNGTPFDESQPRMIAVGAKA